MLKTSSEEQFTIHDIKDKILWGIKIRYAVFALGLFLLGFAYYNKLEIGFGLALILFVAFYNLIAHLIYQLKKHYQLWQVVLFRSVFQVFDVLAITFLVYVSGGLESPYWFLYLVLIVISGFGAFSYASLSVFLIAVFSAVFYLGLLMLTYFGILPTYGPGFMLTPQQLLRSIFNKAVFTTVSFFLFAATIYYFSKLISQHRHELSQKNRELLITLEELKEIDRLKDEFVTNASHELRTPLSVIRENVSLIEDGVVGGVNEKQRRLLETSRLNIDRLANILDNMLDISRIESRSLVINRQRVDLCELAARAVELLKGRAQEKGITVETDLTCLAVAWVDPDHILRVFINFLDNALKYMDKGGKVRIGAEVTRDMIKGYVSDSGPGIPKKELPRVFERFVRIGDKSLTAPKGAGLGLSICKGLIEMQGGRIWVESEVGKGSKFIFALPRIELSE